MTPRPEAVRACVERALEALILLGHPDQSKDWEAVSKAADLLTEARIVLDRELERYDEWNR